MTRPEVLELIDVHPGTTARLGEAYVLHRLWEAPERARLIADVAPGEPEYKDIFDLTPWYTNWMKAEAAKKRGDAPAAPSIMDLTPRR